MGKLKESICTWDFWHNALGIMSSLLIVFGVIILYCDIQRDKTYISVPSDRVTVTAHGDTIDVIQFYKDDKLTMTIDCK